VVHLISPLGTTSYGTHFIPFYTTYRSFKLHWGPIMTDANAMSQIAELCCLLIRATMAVKGMRWHSLTDYLRQLYRMPIRQDGGQYSHGIDQ